MSFEGMFCIQLIVMNLNKNILKYIATHLVCSEIKVVYSTYLWISKSLLRCKDYFRCNRVLRKIDIITLVSGDGDFDLLAKEVKIKH